MFSGGGALDFERCVGCYILAVNDEGDLVCITTSQRSCQMEGSRLLVVSAEGSGQLP